MTTISDAIGEFTLDFYHCITREHSRKNILFSPVNLTSAFGQLALSSGAEQATQIKKVLHWDEVKVDERPRNQRCPISAKNYGQTTNRPMLQSEPTYSKQRPCPEPIHSKCRPSPEPAYPEPTWPNSRSCPESSKSPCPERDVPEYECETPKGVQTAFSKILAVLNAPSTNYSLIFADKVYVDIAIKIFQKLAYCILKLYQTDVGGADMRNDPELVRNTMNLWVEVKTHGKIMDLFPKNSFDCLAQMLQINALYFRGQWRDKFDKQLTVESTFYQHCADERYCQKVLLMNRKGIYNIATVEIGGIEAQMLEIPYKNNELSLVVLLPTDCSPGAFQQLEEALNYEQLRNYYSLLKPAEVDVFFPRICLESSIYPVDYLDLQNIKDPEKADFSNASNAKNVALTQLIHYTFIEIDEEGGEETETSCCPRNQCAPIGAVAFVANHPFTFHIQDNSTQSFIAAGRFCSPE